MNNNRSLALFLILVFGASWGLLLTSARGIKGGIKGVRTH